jgi:hypothetical protein
MRLKGAVIRPVAFDLAVDDRSGTVAVADSGADVAGEDVADNETDRRRIEATATKVVQP